MELKNRKYKSGSGFAFWRWTEIETDGSLYLRRLHIIQVPKVGAIMLHWILRPDRSRDLHDHPVSFLSLVLRGSYIELVPVATATTYTEGVIRERIYTDRRYIRWLNFKRATDAHCITEVFGPRGALTLVFAGPKVRQWGFYTKEGWIPWPDYKEPN